jgi:hypothetical protein
MPARIRQHFPLSSIAFMAGQLHYRRQLPEQQTTDNIADVKIMSLQHLQYSRPARKSSSKMADITVVQEKHLKAFGGGHYFQHSPVPKPKGPAHLIPEPIKDSTALQSN